MIPGNMHKPNPISPGHASAPGAGARTPKFNSPPSLHISKSNFEGGLLSAHPARPPQRSPQGLPGRAGTVQPAPHAPQFAQLRPSAPPVYRPAMGLAARAPILAPRPGRSVARPRLVQSPAGWPRSGPSAVQPRMAITQPRVYPNLNPSAAVPVNHEEVFKLRDFFGSYRLQRGSEHGVYVPNSKYIFVRMASSETLLHPRFRHPALAEGRPVHYAGEAYFNNGQLEWWSNGSGNYRPDSDHALQANLPMDRFYTFEEILKGVHRHHAHVSGGAAAHKPGNKGDATPANGKEATTANANAS